MFLKSVEIRGFKSFAEKTELDFRRGITAVVGPNGSGKSNISDAIRWVLGEQSVKSLRGGKMEDVIFAGTQYRKPVGLAQVALTLDNSEEELPIDYSSVTVSRRLYRSGESEYFINNTSCRLKDVHELFMDTGIGKEGYSIIGQGKIDAILSGRPEERRALLEEAAGIVKFKTRKEEAEKKLNNTQQNLVRINDILSTYEERLEPLRIDNEKAQKFIKLSDELKVYEISMIINSLKNIKDNLEKSLETISISKNHILKLTKDREEIRVSTTNLEKDLDEEEVKNSEEKARYYKDKEALSELENEIQIITERIQNTNSNILKNNDRAKELIEKLEFLSNDKSNKETELINLKNKSKTINEEVQVLENTVQKDNVVINEIEGLVKRLRDNQITILKSISEHDNNLSLVKSEKESIEGKLQALESACNNYENSIKINMATVLGLQEKVESIKVDINKFEDEIKERRREISKINANIMAMQRLYKEKTQSHNKMEANQHMLENLEKQYEGYTKSVKNLMTNINNNKIEYAKGKCFVLGEIIKVPMELETAMEIALGAAISDLITEDEKIAKGLIDYLKRTNGGRATFLPLSIIKGKKITLNQSVKNIKGYIGIASELIEYDEKFSNAINYVIGRTIICDTMESGLNIAKAIDYSNKIVTLQGEVINPGGALTGGSIYNKSVNIIGRKREIDELKVKLEEVAREIEILGKEIENNNISVKNLDELCLNLRDEIHYKNIELTKVQSEITSITQETSKVKVSLQSSRDEQSKLTLKIESKANTILVLKEKIDVLSKEEEENKNLIKDKEVELDTLNEEIKERKDKLVILKINKAQIDETLLSSIKEVNRLEKDVDEINKGIEVIKLETTNMELTIASFNKKIQENKVEIDTIKDKLNAISKDFEKYEANRIRIKNVIKQNFEKISTFDLDIHKEEEKLNRLNLTKTKYDMEEENYLKKLNEEMDLTYAEAEEKAEPIENIDEYKKTISSIKGQIGALGTVNLGAIEEYKEISEKYSFMHIQREDLEKAKDELIGVIEEMTLKMKEVFRENFKILRKNFSETFSELFKGGTADLILSDGDELTSVIDINVQPPGKKLQNINLMSGGEKVLSAIALLFAILKMKPTPFCILDEIEAALDDANVYRYAEYLKKFANNIQFIVITHRKGTMEASDVLYGVTMEEKGVSKIVSVDLNTK